MGVEGVVAAAAATPDPHAAAPSTGGQGGGNGHDNDHDHDRDHNHDARSGNRGAAHNKREHGVRKLWKSVIGKRLRNQCWKTGLWTRSVVGKRHQIWGRKAAPNMGRIMVPGSLG